MKISPPPSLRSHLISLPMGIFLGDYGNWSAIDSVPILVSGVVATYYSYM